MESKSQVNLDSLWVEWNDTLKSDTSRLNALRLISLDTKNNGKLDSANILTNRYIDFASEKGLKMEMAEGLYRQAFYFWSIEKFIETSQCFHRSLDLYEEVGNEERMAYVLNFIGILNSEIGDKIASLNYYQKALEISEKAGELSISSSIMSNIGEIYKFQGDVLKAQKYYEKALVIKESIREQSGRENLVNIATINLNIGDVYCEQGDFEKAFEYYDRSLAIFEETESDSGQGKIYRSIGYIHFLNEDYPLALEYFEKSIEFHSTSNLKNDLSNDLIYDHIYVGGVLLKQGDFQGAIDQCLMEFDQDNTEENLMLQWTACECLYKAYKGLNSNKIALQYHEMMLELDDRMKAGEVTKSLERMEFQKRLFQDSLIQTENARLILESHQEEVRQKDKTRNIGFGIGAFFVMLAIGFFSRWRYVRKSRDIISIEKDRSENLLLNILPADIVIELKEKGRVDARDFEMVSILFTDFKGFTAASEKLTAQELVAEINICFEAFDGIIGKYNLEKIKTIGDAYMAVGGLPIPADDSVKNTVLTALEMQAFIGKRKADNEVAGQTSFEMRVGIHSGPVVAGIVGVKKFQYDIWGDTVNTASRMESNGDVGKVNVSQSTYDLLKNDPEFVFEYRGKMEVKGKGEMEMYFVRLKSGDE